MYFGTHCCDSLFIISFSLLVSDGMVQGKHGGRKNPIEASNRRPGGREFCASKFRSCMRESKVRHNEVTKEHCQRMISRDYYCKATTYPHDGEPTRKQKRDLREFIFREGDNYRAGVRKLPRFFWPSDEGSVPQEEDIKLTIQLQPSSGMQYY